MLLLAVILVVATSYESYWKKGSDLLDQLQNGENEIFVVTFYNPSPVKDDYSRQTENNRVQDELQSEVLNTHDGKPLTIRYTSIDSTDRENEQLMYKAGIKEDFLNNKLTTGRFFAARILPDSAGLLTRIQAGCETMMAMDAEAF